MRHPVLIATALFLGIGFSGCTDSFESEKADARRFLDAELPEGVEVGRVLGVLQAHGLVFTTFTPRECDGFVFEPRFRCLGGSGVVATLASDINPWNPFYSPDLRVFLAFDSSERLGGRTVFVEGGD